MSAAPKKSYPLKKSISLSAQSGFFTHLSVSRENENARQGMQLLLSTLRDNQLTKGLAAYTLNKGNPSIGFGIERGKTLFSIKKAKQDFYFHLNGTDEQHRTEWESLTNALGVKFTFKQTISVNALGNSATSNDELSKLLQFLGYCEQCNYVCEFVGIERPSQQAQSGAVEGDFYFGLNRNTKEQHDFTKALHQKYGGRCVVTGCNISKVLEGAHIKSYADMDKQDRFQFEPHNGLLLRCDIHALTSGKAPLMVFKPLKQKYSQGKGRIKVLLSKELDNSDYTPFKGKIFSVDLSTYQYISDVYNDVLIWGIKGFGKPFS